MYFNTFIYESTTDCFQLLWKITLNNNFFFFFNYPIPFLNVFQFLNFFIHLVRFKWWVKQLNKRKKNNKNRGQSKKLHKTCRPIKIEHVMKMTVKDQSDLTFFIPTTGGFTGGSGCLSLLSSFFCSSLTWMFLGWKLISFHLFTRVLEEFENLKYF